MVCWGQSVIYKVHAVMEEAFQATWLMFQGPEMSRKGVRMWVEIEQGAPSERGHWSLLTGSQQACRTGPRPTAALSGPHGSGNGNRVATGPRLPLGERVGPGDLSE